MLRYGLVTACCFSALLSLSGCTAIGQFVEGFQCEQACVDELRYTELGTREHSQLLILPPLYTVSVRHGDDTEIEREQHLDSSLAFALAAEASSAASAYQIDLRPVSLGPDAEASLQALLEALWEAPRDPGSVRSETPLFGLGAPPVKSQLLDSHLTLPGWTSELLAESCCALLFRINGWRYTRNAAAAKTGTAIAFSAMPGGSGYLPPTSDVIADAVVVRLDDGAVLWSAQYIGPAVPIALRRLVLPYLSTTYNSNTALSRESASLPSPHLPQQGAALQDG